LLLFCRGFFCWSLFDLWLLLLGGLWLCSFDHWGRLWDDLLNRLWLGGRLHFRLSLGSGFLLGLGLLFGSDRLFRLNFGDLGLSFCNFL
jgi:hypothetical protein